MMKNSMIFMWGMLIVTMVVGVFAIGIYEQKNEDRLFVERSFKQAAKDYLSYNENEKPKGAEIKIITFETLDKYDFIEEIKYNNKSCTGRVEVTKHFIFYKYEPKIICE